MLVNGLDVHVTTAKGTFAVSSQRYDGQVVAPEGYRLIESFTDEPWPTWVYRLPDGTRIEQQVFVRQDAPLTAVSWRVIGRAEGTSLAVRALLSTVPERVKLVPAPWNATTSPEVTVSAPSRVAPTLPVTVMSATQQVIVFE